MKKETICNNQKNAVWSEVTIEIPESFQEVADKFHGGDLLAAGEALYKFAVKPANLYVAVRPAKNPQVAADKIFSGIESGVVTAAGRITLAKRVEALLTSGRLDSAQLAMLLGAKTNKEKLRILQKIEEEAQEQAQADPETSKSKPKAKPKAKAKAKAKK